MTFKRNDITKAQWIEDMKIKKAKRKALLISSEEILNKIREEIRKESSDKIKIEAIARMIF